MSVKDWVLDVSFETPCWIPVEGIDTEEPVFVTGMNVIAKEPPGRVRGIVHMNGQDAVEKWIADNPDEAARVKRLAEAKP